MAHFPFICECGYNTMDAQKAVEHARKHEIEDRLAEMQAFSGVQEG